VSFFHPIARMFQNPSPAPTRRERDASEMANAGYTMGRIDQILDYFDFAADDNGEYAVSHSETDKELIVAALRLYREAVREGDIDADDLQSVYVSRSAQR
jgi:hypothetical protein